MKALFTILVKQKYAAVVTVAWLLTGLLTLSNANAEPVIHKVDIADFKFSIPQLEVRTGDIIEWYNSDIVPHTATAIDKSWDTGLIASGASARIEIQVGMFTDYFCLYHPNMKARFQISD